MYNLRDPKQRARYRRATFRRRDSHINAAERIVRVQFKKERKTMIAALPKVGKVDKGAWRETIKRIWLMAGGDGWKYTEENFGDAKRAPTKQVAVFGLQFKQIPTWMRFVARYLDTAGAEKITGIDETTRGAVKAALKEGIALDESIPDLAARVSDIYDGFEGYRSTLIARTETIGAFNMGSLEQARAAGSDLWKIWIATMDDRTREAHAEADGQERPLDEDFDVEDGATEPGSEPNCRCAIGFVLPPESQNE